MDEASRMGRAREMEMSPNDFYHGTHATDITEMIPGDIGVHIGTFEQANNRLIDVGNKDAYGSFRGGKGYAEGANVLPLRAKLGKSLELPDVGQWNDSAIVMDELSKHPALASKLDGLLDEADDIKRSFDDVDDWIDSPENAEFLDEIKKAIADEGYDSVKYKNMAENRYQGQAGMTPRGYAEVEALNKKYHELRKAKALQRPELPDPATATEADVQKWLDAKDAFDKAPDSAHQAQLDAIRAEMDAVMARETLDEHSYIILDPKNLRSKFAAFDPSKADSPNLLYGAGGVGAGTVLADDQNKLRDKKQNKLRSN